VVIAIDGPAGAGKSSVARAVAQALGFTYLDSGAMYRCVALASLQRAGDPATLATEIRIDLGDRVLLDGEDVTDAIRAPEVSERASQVAAEPGVRRAMISRSTPVPIFTSREWTFRTASRPLRSGSETTICRSNRPGRSRAGSITSGRLVAAIRMMP